MSWFSSNFAAGTGFYGDSFPPIINTIIDFGWSLLPQFPGSIRPSQGTGYIPLPIPKPVAPKPPVPVAYEPSGTWGIEAETTFVPEVRPRPAGPAPPPVPRAVVVVDDVSTEVERHESGDFPVGSIFAPGQIWGVSTDLDTAPDIQDDDMALSDILDWGLSTLTGQQPWQLGGYAGPVTPQYAAGISNLPVPSGTPGQPTTITGYTPMGTAMTTTGADCGNRRYVTLDRETGKISCKRRRRRRLLTNRDLADLASLKTITGGGAALNAAVIRAVR